VNDLNAGLTQVLEDGTNTYLYGNDRIAQLPADDSQKADYFLGDVLGSVRQMADDRGAVAYTASYDPYGEVLSTNGEAHTSYGFSGEDTDSYIKLIDLRSRQYFQRLDGSLPKILGKAIQTCPNRSISGAILKKIQ
jgi:hypothetical protein